jgi:AcrR family transcriptional regulator
MTSHDRRKQIVAVAADLFANRGFQGTTTKEIAERAAVSEAIIFRHFATKDELYNAILDDKVKRSIARIETHLKDAASRADDRAFFGALAFELLEFHRNDKAFMRLLLFSALEGHELSKIFFHSTVQRVRRKLLRYIRQRIAAGAYRNIDPAVAARAFTGMLLYQVQVQNVFQTDDLRLSNRLLADRFVEMFLCGLRKPNAQTKGGR